MISSTSQETAGVASICPARTPPVPLPVFADGATISAILAASFEMLKHATGVLFEVRGAKHSFLLSLN